MNVLGIDPGKVTGAAIVQVGAQIPFRVLTRVSVPAEEFPEWLRGVVQNEEIVIDGYAIEKWAPYVGPRAKRGIAQAAFAVGRIVGALEAVGVLRWVEMTRSAILGALEVQSSSRSKAECKLAVRALTDVGDDALSEHEADAIATAIAGAGRMALADA